MAMSNTFELLLDVMVGNHYECQIKYTQPIEPVLLEDGRVAGYLDWDRLNAFVDDYITRKKPSLKYKKYHVEFSKQKAV